MKSEKSITGRVEMTIPSITLFHSASCIELADIFEASALPQTLDMSAWLSLVGSPRNAASVAQSITVMSATESDIIADFGLDPKSAIPYSVLATVGQIIAIITAPARLQDAASRRADLGVSALVETHPAMALGASVQPFTSATPRTRTEKNISIFMTPPKPTV